MKFCTVFLLVAASCFVTDARTVEIKLKVKTRHCEKITAPMCKASLPYSSTEFPNSLDHYSQRMAERSLEIYKDLVATNCSKHLAFFVCAYHLPVCMEAFAEPIRPCREVCEKVKKDCAETIQRLGGSSHADTVRCQDLPSYEAGVCIKEDSFVKKLPDNLSCKEQPRLRYKGYSQRSYAFVLKLTVTSIAKDNGNENTTLVGGNVTRILKRGKVPLKKGLASLSFINAPCLVDILKKGRAYIIAGHEDVPKGGLVVLQNGFVKPGVKKWYSRLKKWETRNNKNTQTSDGKGHTQGQR